MFYANALGPDDRTARLGGLFHYPVKSCAGSALAAARLDRWGLEWDREWMIVDAAGSFVTQRHNPSLARIRPQLVDGMLVLRRDGMPDLKVALAASRTDRRVVRVWRDAVDAVDEGGAASDWVSAAIGVRAHLVRFPMHGSRYSDARWTGADDFPVHFGDGWALHAIFARTMEHLERETGEPLDRRRFRANMLFDAMPAFSEDHVVELRHGGHVLRFVKPCARCVTTATDQDLGIRASDAALRWLRANRMDKASGGPTVGQNVVVVRAGAEPVRIGSEWTVVAGDSRSPARVEEAR